ncbi:MAG: response regulator transcription factor, partial [Chloroflexota bacterium]
MKRNILIADEADLVLIGAQTILKDHPEFEVIHSARSGDDLLDAARRCLPEVILFNERLDPLIDVLALVERLKHSAPDAHLIVLGSQADGLLVRDLFACGVLGYLFSGDDLRDCLIPALSVVLNNRPYLSPTANSEYLVAMQSPLRDWKLDSEARAVLRLLARGMHVNDIAAQMDVPLRRIYWVRQKLRKRFGANTNEH